MIERETFYAYPDEPEQCDSVLLARLNEWRQQHRDVAILGVQWLEDVSRVTCIVTFEHRRQPVLVKEDFKLTMGPEVPTELYTATLTMKAEDWVKLQSQLKAIPQRHENSVCTLIDMIEKAVQGTMFTTGD